MTILVISAGKLMQALQLLDLKKAKLYRLGPNFAVYYSDTINNQLKNLCDHIL